MLTVQKKTTGLAEQAVMKSQRGNSRRIVSERTVRWLPERSCGVLLLATKYLRFNGWWTDTSSNEIWCTDGWNSICLWRQDQSQTPRLQIRSPSPSTWRKDALWTFAWTTFFHAGGDWTRDLLIVDWTDMEMTDSTSEIHFERLNYSHIQIDRCTGSLPVPSVDGSLKQDTVRSFWNHDDCSDTEDVFNAIEKFQNILDTGHPAEDNRHVEDHRMISDDYICRYHHVQRDALCTYQEAFFQSLKYIDVQRQTHTDLDNTEENVMNDYWNLECQESSLSIDLNEPFSKSPERVFHLITNRFRVPWSRFKKHQDLTQSSQTYGRPCPRKQHHKETKFGKRTTSSTTSSMMTRTPVNSWRRQRPWWNLFLAKVKL